MSNIIPNSFTAYELTDKETLEGSIYNTVQTQVLQNHLATKAEEKLALKYDPNDREVYLQQEAALTAEIEIIQYLLDCSLAAQEALSNPNQTGEI